MKKILLILTIAFAFTACNKCVECTQEDSSGDNYQISANGETFGDYIEEICSDNFESKDDFNDYIEELEDEYNYDCKSDFFN